MLRTGTVTCRSMKNIRGRTRRDRRNRRTILDAIRINAPLDYVILVPPSFASMPNAKVPDSIPSPRRAAYVPAALSRYDRIPDRDLRLRTREIPEGPPQEQSGLWVIESRHGSWRHEHGAKTLRCPLRGKRCPMLHFGAPATSGSSRTVDNVVNRVKPQCVPLVYRAGRSRTSDQ